jgi:hypothetical protein
VAEDYGVLDAAQTVSETDSFTAQRYVQFARHLGSAMSILDVGCNTGQGGVVQVHDERPVGGVSLPGEGHCGRRSLDEVVTWGGSTCERFSVPFLQ